MSDESLSFDRPHASIATNNYTRPSEMSSSEGRKPHAVCLPFPAQGHINPMMKLAMLLNHRGFHITFVNTEHNHKRLLKSRGPHALDGLPSFCFETIPDGLPPTESHADATQDIPSLFFATRDNCLSPFRKLLEKLNQCVPPVTFIIADSVMTFAVVAAQETGVPSAVFRTSTACCFILNRYYRHLTEKGLLPLQDASDPTKGHLDRVVDGITGIKSIRLKDLPSFLQSTKRNDPVIEFVLGESDRASQASAIIFTTFDALEQDTLDALSLMYPQIYSIGPLHSLVNQLPDNSRLKSIGCNLWKEETECLKWLDTKQANSVLYVNYGSITIMTSQQILEFAWGLANSKQSFLWIIRPDLVMHHTVALPREFVEETKERGLIAEWCPQEQVLDHPSVGGFLTHCGWNSVIESLSSGVPMLCWPFFADQPTNCRQACSEWGVGMEIDHEVKRDEVERLVPELMVGKKGKEMRNRAMEWKKKAQVATSMHGSSSLNLEKLVKLLLSQVNHED